MSDDEIKVVTHDKGMSDETRSGKLSAADESVLNPDPAGLIEITTAEQLMQLAEMAKRTFDVFRESITPRMTPERAAAVRELRCGPVMHSWRALAEESFKAWGADATWSPPSNQLAGMALCEIAAGMLGEDHRAAPWN
jgi:hypothetical protein